MSSTIAVPPPTQTRLASIATFFRITVDDYHDMIRNDILTTEDRVELLDGYLVNKSKHTLPHSSTNQRMTHDLSLLLPKGWRAWCQLPITLANSEPEPDAAIVRGDRRTYDHRHPTASDFGIIIEVADSSLTLDRREKGRIYAEAGIPEYWIVNLPDQQVEVYTMPNAVAYQQNSVYRSGQTVPLTLDGVLVGSLPVADLLP